MLYASEFYAARRAVEEDADDVVEKVEALAGCLYTRPDCPVAPGLLVDLAEQAPLVPNQKQTLLNLLDIVGNWLAEVSVQPSVTVQTTRSITQDIMTGVAVAVLSTVAIRLLGV